MEEVVHTEVEKLHAGDSAPGNGVLVHQTDETPPSCTAQGMHALGGDGYLGDTGTEVLGRQGRTPNQVQAEKEQRVVVSLKNARTFTEIKDVQGVVAWERHEGSEVKFREAARNVTLICT